MKQVISFRTPWREDAKRLGHGLVMQGRGQVFNLPVEGHVKAALAGFDPEFREKNRFEIRSTNDLKNAKLQRRKYFYEFSLKHRLPFNNKYECD